MKRLFVVFLVIVLVLSGCVSVNDYDAIVAERDALRSELTALKATPEPSVDESEGAWEEKFDIPSGGEAQVICTRTNGANKVMALLKFDGSDPDREAVTTLFMFATMLLMENYDVSAVNVASAGNVGIYSLDGQTTVGIKEYEAVFKEFNALESVADQWKMFDSGDAEVFQENLGKYLSVDVTELLTAAQSLK